MRSTVFTLVLILAIAGVTVGCCGTPSATKAAPARTAAMASTTTHSGCHFDAGFACGGESVFGMQVDLPDIRPLFNLFQSVVPMAPQAPATYDPCAEVAPTGAMPEPFPAPASRVLQCADGACCHDR